MAELIGAPTGGAILGWVLDRWLHTAPWLMGLFVLLGGAAGIANVWRLMLPRG